MAVAFSSNLCMAVFYTSGGVDGNAGVGLNAGYGVVLDFYIDGLGAFDGLQLGGPGLLDGFTMAHPPGCPLFDVPLRDARAGRQ